MHARGMPFGFAHAPVMAGGLPVVQVGAEVHVAHISPEAAQMPRPTAAEGRRMGRNGPLIRRFCARESTCITA